MNSVWIQDVKLSNVGPFNNLSVSFQKQPGLSLVCGDNGVGKTTLLDSIVASFARGNLDRLRKKQGSDKGTINLEYNINGIITTVTTPLKTFEPDQNETKFSTTPGIASNIINITARRDFGYARQLSISRDPTNTDINISTSLLRGVDASEIKSWFSNRWLMLPHKDSAGWSPDMVENLNDAITYISLLDQSVTLDRVDVKTFDIMVRTATGIIPFEYLSSGFRSAYVLLLGIIKEIEFRGLGVSARNFQGVIVIDELDLHLHPSWQQEIGAALKKAFPKAQIIASTHSPHIIQAAEPSEVIVLVRDDNGDVTARAVASSNYGYAGWTIEEILRDVMGVVDTKTSIFRTAVYEFDCAIDSEDSERVQRALTVLMEMLHPENPLRKLIQIQAAPYKFTGEGGAQ